MILPNKMATIFQESTQTGKLQARANTTFISVQSGKLQPNIFSKDSTPAPFQRTRDHSECLDTAKDLVLL
jgi:hypothetical protein